MNLLESLDISWRTIRDHPLRSSLTTLGVVIGVAAVILFVALSASLQAAIIGDFHFGSPQNLWLMAARESEDPAGFGSGPAVFTPTDLAALKELDRVAAVIPVGTVRVISLEFAEQRHPLSRVIATAPEHFAAEGLAFQAGNPFSDGQAEVILSEVMVGRFDPRPQVGDLLVLTLWEANRAVEARLAGVLEPPAQTIGFLSPTERGHVYVPVGSLAEGVGGGAAVEPLFRQLIVVAEDVTVVEALSERLADFLAQEAEAAGHLPEGYRLRVVTNQLVLDQIRSFINTFTSYITGIALISLVVGSIGIANIMLVSVAERTREIGIMKALGGLRRDILVLFLSEAVIIGILGALLGTALGAASAYVAAGYLELPFRFPLVWVAVAAAVGILVGVLSGLYPAWQAASVDPIEALRYE